MSVGLALIGSDRLSAKKPRTMPGLLSCAGENRLVSGDERSAIATKAVVEAYGDHIQVLGDSTEHTGAHRRNTRKILATHEKVVVFKTDRPVGREAILESD